jgi:hypothetical protein
MLVLSLSTSSWAAFTITASELYQHDLDCRLAILSLVVFILSHGPATSAFYIMTSVNHGPNQQNNHLASVSWLNHDDLHHSWPLTAGYVILAPFYHRGLRPYHQGWFFINWFYHHDLKCELLLWLWPQFWDSFTMATILSWYQHGLIGWQCRNYNKISLTSLSKHLGLFCQLELFSIIITSLLGRNSIISMSWIIITSLLSPS